MRWIYLLCAFFISSSLCGQHFTERDGRYLLLRAGSGPVYGGLVGGSIEYGKDLISGYASVGTIPAFTTQEGVDVPGSLNFGGGARFHMTTRVDRLRTRAGVHVGWLENYYAAPIKDDPYDPIVYGGMFTFGTEFTTRVLSLEADLSFQPGWLIFNPSSHPFFSGSFSISGGIGVNLFALRKKEVHQWDRQYQETQSSMCFNNFRRPWFTDDGWCDKGMVWQKMEEDQFVVFTFNIADMNPGTTCLEHDLTQEDAKVQVWLIDGFNPANFPERDQLTAENLENIFGKDKVWQAVEGTCNFVFNRGDCTEVLGNKRVKLSAQALKVVFRNSSDLEKKAQAKSISIWNVPFKDKCQ